jgi:hypothetical protein
MAIKNDCEEVSELVRGIYNELKKNNEDIAE